MRITISQTAKEMIIKVAIISFGFVFVRLVIVQEGGDVAGEDA